jgi:hypothetical protein
MSLHRKIGILNLSGQKLGFLGLTMPEQGKLIRGTGPYSREAAIARPRRRTRESRFLEKTREDLTAHCGGDPSTTQKLLIERIAMTLLRIELMDRDALNDKSGVLTETQTKNYLAWENTVSRMLRHLGLEKSNEAKPAPSDHWSGLTTDHTA